MEENGIDYQTILKEILESIIDWDEKNDSEKYNVEYKEKRIPPKVVLHNLYEYLKANSFPNNVIERIGKIGGGIPTNQFIESYGFKITEDISYNKTEYRKFKNHYTKKIRNKELFQSFIHFGNQMLDEWEIEPYKVRMAIESAGDVSIIVGMRCAYSYDENKRKARIGFLISKEFKKATEDRINYVYEYDYKGEPEQDYIKLEAEHWDDIPEEILEEHIKQFKLQYDEIKNSKMTTWKLESNTTNNTIKHLMFEGEDVEDFLKNLKLNRMEKIDISGKNVYKLSMGTFLKTRDFKNKNLLQTFEDNNWAVMGKYTSKGQGDAWVNEVIIGDYIYLTFGQDKLSHLAKIISEVQELPSDINKMIGNDEFVYREYEIIKEPKLNNTRNLTSDKREWLPSGYSTFIRLLDIKEANNILFEPYYGVKFINENVIKISDKNPAKFFEKYELWLHANKDVEKEIINEYILNAYNFIAPFFSSEIKYLKINRFERDTLEFIRGKLNLKPNSFGGQEYFNLFISHLIPNKKMPLNQILYGPPGTGKTFRLQDEYFEKFTVRESSLTRKQYLENMIADKTWWQVLSMTVLDLGNVTVNEIMEHELIKTKAELSNSKLPRTTIWGRLQAHTVGECKNVNVSDRSEPRMFFKDDDTKWSVDKNLLEEYYPEAISNLEDSKNFQPSSDKLIKNYEFVTFHQSFSYEDFIEGIKPKMEEQDTEVSYEIADGVFKKLALKAKADPDNNYAIFIDEINRGNVSAIFGELITLLEEDKRIGGDNPLSVKLPYSKNEFEVPSNLYVFGTMNTADRSVEALDTALRRRFSFKEIMPEPSLLEDIEFDGFNLDEVLKTINERIEFLLDRDHTIGHSYFMNLKSDDTVGLEEVFKNKVIPLLQEYFYHDYEKIALILGEGFVTVKTNHQVKFPVLEGITSPDQVTLCELVNDIEDIEAAVLKLLNRNGE